MLDAYRRSPGLHAFLAAGGRKVDAWTAGLRLVQVPFDAPGDDPRAFANANTLNDIARSLQGYDPQALRIADANTFIDHLVASVQGTELLPLR